MKSVLIFIYTCIWFDFSSSSSIEQMPSTPYPQTQRLVSQEDQTAAPTTGFFINIPANHPPTPLPTTDFVAPTTPVPKKSTDPPTAVPTTDFVAPTTPVPKKSTDPPTAVPTTDFVAPTTPVPKKSTDPPTAVPTTDFFIEIPTDYPPTPTPTKKRTAYPTPVPTTDFVAPTTPAPKRIPTPHPSVEYATYSPTKIPTPVPVFVDTAAPTPSPTCFPTPIPTLADPIPFETSRPSSSPTTVLLNSSNRGSGTIESSTYMFYSFVLVMVVGGTCAYFYKNFKNALASTFSGPRYSAVSTSGDGEFDANRYMASYAPPDRETELARFSRMSESNNTYPPPNSSFSNGRTTDNRFY